MLQMLAFNDARPGCSSIADTPRRALRAPLVLALVSIALSGCGERKPDPPTPAQVRARVLGLLPATLPDRKDWAADIQASFAALELDPTVSNLCAVLAVTEQESTYTPDPEVPGLAKIARAEIDRRAQRLNIPALVVTAALRMKSPDGRSWEDRIARVRTEKQLNTIFEELIDEVPMGRKLFAGANPVRTGGPMQVSIAFAERHARDRPYPFPMAGSVREEVFTRRGGMYFGIAHLLGYRVSYNSKLYRFADFNAGWYASRNAAFQHAVSVASGIPLDLDGDLIRHDARDANDIGQTEVATRVLARRWDVSDAQVRRALSRAHRFDFEQTDLYRQVFEAAERTAGGPLARARVPQILLQSPKITRKLTTQWFATRVDRRYRACLERGTRG